MKKMLPVMVVALVFLSCKKEDALKEFKESLVGTWELEKRITFEVPFTTLSSPPGNGNILVFTTGGVFEKKKHDTLVFQGTYTLQRREDCHPRTSNVVLQTSDNTPANEHYVTIENGKLLIDTPNCWADGGAAYYRKIQ
jgi:hypothetical protein